MWLDGKALEFEQGGKRVEHVEIPATWDGPPRLGRNRGTAGVVFGSEENRGALGGQRVRNLAVTRLDAK